LQEVRVPQNWVARVVDEERRKDQAHSRDEAAAAVHHADVVRFHLPCLMVALKDPIARDVEAFARELPDHRVSFEECTPDDGFAVRRDCYPEAHPAVTPNLHDGSIRVQYLFASADGLSAPKLMELVPDADRGFSVHLRDGSEQSFASVEQLSEYLLVPLFTGQPR
jgi:hypothetical protein